MNCKRTRLARRLKSSGFGALLDEAGARGARTRLARWPAACGCARRMLARRHRGPVAVVSRLAASSALMLAVAACTGEELSTPDPDPPVQASAANVTTARAAGSDTASAAGASTEWPETLVVGAVPSEESSALRESFDGLVRVLEADLGIDVDFFQAADYAEIIEAQSAGRVHLVSYGPFSYVLATDSGADIRAFGALVDSADAAPGYVSYGVARTDNQALNELADLAGRTVCFVDPASTSGYLYPTAGLLAAGIDPERDIAPVFAGGHDASVVAVHAGKCDAGFAYDEMVESALIDAGRIGPGDIKIIWRSETIASSPIAVLTSLPSDLRSEIRRIVLEEANSDRLAERGFCDSPQDCRVTDEDAWGWTRVNDAFYDGVRKVLSLTQPPELGNE